MRKLFLPFYLIVAHELRIPLARLRYRLALLDDEVTSRQEMDQDLDEVDKLIEELLLHAKLDHPEAPLSVSVFNTRAWLKDRLAAQQDLSPGLTWSQRIDQLTASTLLADRHLLSRALDNLLANARRYAKSLIRIIVTTQNGYYFLIVDDDGPGVPVEDRERIFSAFVRLDHSRGRTTGGYGLGLAIVGRIAQAHHGRVWVESSPEGGARFLFSWRGGSQSQQLRCYKTGHFTNS